MSDAPLKTAGDPVFEWETPLHEVKPVVEALEAEFPDIPRDQIAAACEAVKGDFGGSEDQEALKAKVRERLRQRLA